MQRTIASAAPVISILSPSLEAAKNAQRKLMEWSSFRENLSNNSITCAKTGTTLHWKVSSETSSTKHSAPHELLAIQDAERPQDAISRIEQAVQSRASSPTMKFKRFIGKRVTAKDLLGTDLPFLHLSSDTESDSSLGVQALTSGSLKELVIPAFDDSTYASGDTLFSSFSCSSLRRPVTGLYQFSNGLCIRPLPSATEDKSLPRPSFIFHVDDLQDAVSTLGEATDVSKIGFTGVGKGQLMISHDTLQGLDVRLCESKRYSSAFAEAQDSLLAGSLHHLQSTNVLAEGKPGKLDPRTNNMDCWVEFRATMFQPTGFFKRKKAPAVARAPDLPYE